MKINEIFYSIQGEGKLAGLPSAFIRTTGCNLRCTWCDSPDTSWRPQGEAMEIEEILDRLAEYPTAYAVLTGGEPMIAPQVEALTHRLKDAGYHITIETAATHWKDVSCDLASISPKLAHSTPWNRDDARFADAHEESRLNLPVIRRFMTLPDYQIKFVVDSPADLAEIDLILARLEPCDPSNVLLMPQGVTQDELAARAAWIAPICKQRAFRFCPRLHIALYGHTPAT